MPNPVSTSDIPDVLDKKIRKVYIKDGRRKISTDTGVMFLPADVSRKMFGKHRGGRYGYRQEIE